MNTERFADLLDRLRVIPRILAFGYGWMMWEVAQWFMSLPDPNSPQAAFVSTIAGAAAGVFGFYVNSGARK